MNGGLSSANLIKSNPGPTMLAVAILWSFTGLAAAVREWRHRKRRPRVARNDIYG